MTDTKASKLTYEEVCKAEINRAAELGRDPLRFGPVEKEAKRAQEAERLANSPDVDEWLRSAEQKDDYDTQWLVAQVKVLRKTRQEKQEAFLKSLPPETLEKMKQYAALAQARQKEIKSSETRESKKC